MMNFKLTILGIILSFTSTLSLFSSTDIENTERVKVLTLKSVIEQGLRENPQAQINAYQEKIVEFKKDDNYANFWFPKISLVIKADNQRTGRFNHDDAYSNSSKIPSGYFGLESKEYTLFNWGKDYADYLNQKGILEQRADILKEERIRLKHSLILAYFYLAKERNIETIYKDNLRHAAFIYRMSKEKSSIRKMGPQRFLQAKLQYFTAQRAYSRARVSLDMARKQMAKMIGDDPSLYYRLLEELKFYPLKISLSSSLSTFPKKNVTVKNRQEDLRRARRNFETELKENLPLPKFSINLGSYIHSFNRGGSDTRYDTSRYKTGGSDLEIRASLDASWAIVGPGGFFNYRRRSTSYYHVQMSQIQLKENNHNLQTEIRTKFKSIDELEKQYNVILPAIDSSRKFFNQALENYFAKKTSFIDLKDSLNSLKETQELYENIRFEHLKSKIELCELMGVEDFPGENFENLAVREVKKP